MHRWRDESGLIVSWILRLFLVFAAFGVVAYDAGSILVNHFTLDSRAGEIALELSSDTVVEPDFFNPTEARRTARKLARESDARLVGFEIERDGTVTVRLRREATTLIVGRISAIEDWARATADASASPTQ
jgi:hypothetical protein